MFILRAVLIGMAVWWFYAPHVLPAVIMIGLIGISTFEAIQHTTKDQSFTEGGGYIWFLVEFSLRLGATWGVGYLGSQQYAILQPLVGTLLAGLLQGLLLLGVSFLSLENRSAFLSFLRTITPSERMTQTELTQRQWVEQEQNKRQELAKQYESTLKRVCQTYQFPEELFWNKPSESIPFEQGVEATSPFCFTPTPGIVKRLTPDEKWEFYATMLKAWQVNFQEETTLGSEPWLVESPTEIYQGYQLLFKQLNAHLQQWQGYYPELMSYSSRQRLQAVYHLLDWTRAYLKSRQLGISTGCESLLWQQQSQSSVQGLLTQSPNHQVLTHVGLVGDGTFLEYEVLLFSPKGIYVFWIPALQTTRTLNLLIGTDGQWKTQTLEGDVPMSLESRGFTRRVRYLERFLNETCAKYDKPLIQLEGVVLLTQPHLHVENRWREHTVLYQSEFLDYLSVQPERYDVTWLNEMTQVIQHERRAERAERVRDLTEEVPLVLIPILQFLEALQTECMVPFLNANYEMLETTP